MPLPIDNDAATSLERAQIALETIKQHSDKHWSNNRKSFKFAWSDLLIYGGRTFTKTEQLSKLTKNPSWFSKHRSNRQNDTLLAYLWHARNADEHHGLAIMYETVNGSLNYTIPSGKPFEIELHMDSKGQAYGIPKYNWIKVDENTPAKHVLQRVFDRGVEYKPPVVSINGISFVIEPIDCAEKYIDYLTAMITELNTQKLKNEN